MVFLKRVVPLFFVVLIVVCISSIGVSASGSGLGRLQFSVIPFTEIGYDSMYRTKVDFAGNLTVCDSPVFVDVTESLAGDASTAVVQTVYGGSDRDHGLGTRPNNQANVEIQVPMDQLSIRLYARDFVLNRSEFQFLSMGFGQDYVDGNVAWDIVLYTVKTPNEGDYVLDRRRITGNADIRSGENFVDKIMPHVTLFEGRPYIFFERFDLTFTSDQDVPDGYFDFQYSVAPSSFGVDNWFEQYNLNHVNLTELTMNPANPDDVSFVRWLGKAVGSFLEWELWNGFSLNQLIEFIVVIGLVFWFITLLI